MTDDHDFSFAVPLKSGDLTVIGQIDNGFMSYTQLRLSSYIVSAYGQRKGGYTSLDVKQSGRAFLTGTDIVPKIQDASELEDSTRAK